MRITFVLLEIITQILRDSTGLNVMQVKSSSFFFNRRQLKKRHYVVEKQFTEYLKLF
jgi:hypothetical protein